MRVWWRIAFVVFLVVASAAVGFFADPWSGLQNWFGASETDEKWAHVALAGIAFVVLLVLCTIVARGLPKLFEFFGMSMDFEDRQSGAPDLTEPVAHVHTLVRSQTDTISLLGEQLRQIRELEDTRAERGQEQLRTISARVEELSRRLDKLDGGDS